MTTAKSGVAALAAIIVGTIASNGNPTRRLPIEKIGLGPKMPTKTVASNGKRKRDAIRAKAKGS